MANERNIGGAYVARLASGEVMVGHLGAAVPVVLDVNEARFVRDELVRVIDAHAADQVKQLTVKDFAR